MSKPKEEVLFVQRDGLYYLKWHGVTYDASPFKSKRECELATQDEQEWQPEKELIAVFQDEHSVAFRNQRQQQQQQQPTFHLCGR